MNFGKKKFQNSSNLSITKLPLSYELDWANSKLSVKIPSVWLVDLEMVLLVFWFVWTTRAILLVVGLHL